MSVKIIVDLLGLIAVNLHDLCKNGLQEDMSA